MIKTKPRAASQKQKLTASGYIVKIKDVFIFSTFFTIRDDTKKEMQNGWPNYKEAKIVKVKIIEQ